VLIDYLRLRRELSLQEVERVAGFARELPDAIKLALAPEIDIGVPNLAAISRVADYLTGGSRILRSLEGAAARVRAGTAESSRRRAAH
jgi:pilus assembly protein TadC